MVSYLGTRWQWGTPMEDHSETWEPDDSDSSARPILHLLVQLLTIEHAASALDVSESTVKRLLMLGELRRVRLSAHVVRVRSDDIAAYIARHTEDSLDADVSQPDRDSGPGDA